MNCPPKINFDLKIDDNYAYALSVKLRRVLEPLCATYFYPPAGLKVREGVHGGLATELTFGRKTNADLGVEVFCDEEILVQFTVTTDVETARKYIAAIAEASTR